MYHEMVANEFEERVYDTYLQEWKAEVDETSTARMYKHVKFYFGFENYLNMYNAAFRVAITRIRLSSHLFHVERGRWGRRRIALEDRVCTQCLTVEDEYHCIIECVRYLEERKGCLPDNLRTKPSMFEFVKYFKCKDNTDFKKMGLLCFKIMKKHKEYLLL